jgi:hypothetical protein
MPEEVPTPALIQHLDTNQKWVQLKKKLTGTYQWRDRSLYHCSREIAYWKVSPVRCNRVLVLN